MYLPILESQSGCFAQWGCLYSATSPVGSVLLFRIPGKYLLGREALRAPTRGGLLILDVGDADRNRILGVSMLQKDPVVSGGKPYTLPGAKVVPVLQELRGDGEVGPLGCFDVFFNRQRSLETGNPNDEGPV